MQSRSRVLGKLSRLSTIRSACFKIFVCLIVCVVTLGRESIAQPTRTKTALLPGWEDLVIGNPPPFNSKQLCEAPLPNTPTYEKCDSCRSASLALPCVTFTIFDGLVNTVIAELPWRPNKLARTNALLTSWGRPTTTMKSEHIAEDCWPGTGQATRLMTNFYDDTFEQHNSENVKDWTATSTRRQYPLRVIFISGGTCSAGAKEAFKTPAPPVTVPPREVVSESPVLMPSQLTPSILETLPVGAMLSFDHSTGKFETMTQDGSFVVIDSLNIQACVAFYQKLAERNAQCSRGKYSEDKYTAFWDQGDGSRCYKVSAVRDIESLKECQNGIEQNSCRSFAKASKAPVCRNQFKFAN